jgi:hypothetical protein
MAKVALLIGVSEYGSGLNPFPGAVRAVEAMQRVLQPLEKGGFDEVKQLLNPNPPVMRKAIETLFSGRTKNDLVVLFFSSHIVQEDSGKLFFTTSITCKSSRAELVRVSAIPATVVHDIMNNSECQRQVVILDGCLERLSADEMTSHDDVTVDIKTQLGGEGRAILTSFTSIQNSFEPEKSDHPVYTQYLVEGIRTRAADLDSDGWISVDELHEYASNKVQIAAPTVKPQYHPVEDGLKILLLAAPKDDPKLKYRKEAESWVRNGEISEAGRYILDKVAQRWQLTPEDCILIEAEVIKPYQQYQEKLQRYERELTTTLLRGYALNAQEHEELRSFQQSLGLRDEDVAPIEERIASRLADVTEPEENTNELVLSNVERYLNSVPSMSSEALPQEAPTPPPSPTIPTPAVDLSSSLADSQTSPPASVSTSPNKLLLVTGIGGSLAVLALAIGIFIRKPVAPPTALTDKVSSSPNPSSQPSSTAKNSDKESSPSAIASPQSKVCTIFVNGNLRSEPAGFRNNVVKSLREPLPITGKQTEGGWVEVKLSKNKLAWAYRDIISNEEEMDSCISRKGIKIKKVEDILPPRSSSSP